MTWLEKLFDITNDGWPVALPGSSAGLADNTRIRLPVGKGPLVDLRLRLGDAPEVQPGHVDLVVEVADVGPTDSLVLRRHA